MMSEINGIVKFGPISKGKRKIIITGDDGAEREYDIPRGTHINVQEDDRVRAGEPLMDGPLNPHDILRVLGTEALAELPRERDSGSLSSAGREHQRQAHRGDRSPDASLGEDQGSRRYRIPAGRTGRPLPLRRREPSRSRTKADRPSVGEPLLLGITKASLSTDSFISAASFQETTRVLTEAAISGRVDYLRGLKENVIMGRLIPAGTGMKYYRNVKVALRSRPRTRSRRTSSTNWPTSAAASSFLVLAGVPGVDTDDGYDEAEETLDELSLEEPKKSSTSTKR